MAYRIRYGPDKKRQYKKHASFSFVMYTLAFFLLFVLVANLLVPEQIAQLRRILLPQYPSGTFFRDWEEGESLGQIVSTFCQEIFHGK